MLQGNKVLLQERAGWRHAGVGWCGKHAGRGRGDMSRRCWLQRYLQFLGSVAGAMQGPAWPPAQPTPPPRSCLVLEEQRLLLGREHRQVLAMHALALSAPVAGVHRVQHQAPTEGLQGGAGQGKHSSVTR